MASACYHIGENHEWKREQNADNMTASIVYGDAYNDSAPCQKKPRLRIVPSHAHNLRPKSVNFKVSL